MFRNSVFIARLIVAWHQSSLSTEFTGLETDLSQDEIIPKIIIRFQSRKVTVWVECDLLKLSLLEECALFLSFELLILWSCGIQPFKD